MRLNFIKSRLKFGLSRCLWPNTYLLCSQLKQTVNSQKIWNQKYEFYNKDRANHADKLASQTPLYYAARRGHL